MNPDHKKQTLGIGRMGVTGALGFPPPSERV